MTMQYDITVNNSADIVDARMKVRETARRVGMSPIDQAIISMTTYMLANNLGLGRYGAPHGMIHINGLLDENSRGIKVTCSQASSACKTIATAYYQKMVDEVILKNIDPDILEVSLILRAKF